MLRLGSIGSVSGGWYDAGGAHANACPISRVYKGLPEGLQSTGRHRAGRREQRQRRWVRRGRRAPHGRPSKRGFCEGLALARVERENAARGSASSVRPRLVCRGGAHPWPAPVRGPGSGLRGLVNARQEGAPTVMQQGHGRAPAGGSQRQGALCVYIVYDMCLHAWAVTWGQSSAWKRPHCMRCEEA